MTQHPVRFALRFVLLLLLPALLPEPCRALFRDNNLVTPEWQGASPMGRTSAAGDLNGDGYSDLIIPGSSNVGLLLLEVYNGSLTGPPVAPSQLVDLTSTGLRPASSVVAFAGDCNGDGYDDVLVGDNGYSTLPGSWGGAAMLFLGSSAGLSGTAAWIYEPQANNTYFGFAVASAGDVNGDYLTDFMVSGYSIVQGAGRPFVQLFLSSANGVPAGPLTIASGVQAASNDFGGVGDVDGDGFDDVAVNSAAGLQLIYGASKPPFSRGALLAGLGRGRGLGDVNGDGFADLGSPNGYGILIYHGSPSGPVLEGYIQNRLSTYPSDSFTLPAGDLNGDGIADIAVIENDGPTPTGFLYFGVRQLSGYPQPLAGQVAVRNPGGGGQRPILLPAGDVNGDGQGDFVTVFDTSVSLFCGIGRPPTNTANLTRSSLMPSGGYAAVVGPAGDVNGDGYEDVLVGTPLFSSGQVNEGRAALFLGSAAGVSQEPDWTFESNQPYALFGSALCPAGDVNGDGYADFVVGAYNHSGAVYIEGSIFVFFGGPEGVAGGPEIISGGQLGAGFGSSLAAIHDADGDGYDDLAVGAYAYDGGATNAGAVFVFRGSPTGLMVTPSQRLEGSGAGAGLGYSVSFAGDVDGDGWGDLLVGAPFSSTGGPDAGAAFLYRGNGSGLAESPATSIAGSEPGAHLGLSVCGLGDADGDGKSDVAIAAPNAAAGGLDRGRVSVYPGTSFGVAPVPTSQVTGSVDHAELGSCVWGPGDINADGLTDLVALQSGTTSEGAAYLGGAGGIVPTSVWSVGVGPAYPVLAASTGPVDLNGDGFGDILVPILGSTDGFAAYFGNAAPAIARSSQARGVAGPDLVDGGTAAGPNYIQVRADARTAAGRASVRLEFEGKSRLQAFDGVGTQFSGYRITGSGGGGNGSSADFSEVLTGLPFSSQIKWRVRTRSRSLLFPTSPWRERPLTRMIGWTVRTACETCVSGIVEPPHEEPQVRAVQLAGRPVTLRGRAFPLATWSVRQGEAVLEVLDVTGRLISTNQVRLEAQTWNHLTIQPSAIPAASGVYFIRLRAPWGVDARRVIVE